MKILYCIPSLYNSGGMERILIEKINYLIHNYDVNICIVTTEGNSKKSFFELSSKVEVINLNINFNSVYNYSYLKKYYIVSKLLKKYKDNLETIILNSNIDICISTGGKELEFFTKLNTPCKKVFENHFAKGFRKQFLIARGNTFINNIVGNLRVKQLVLQTKKLDKVVVLTKNDQIEWEKTNNNISQIYNFRSVQIDGVSSLKNKRAIAIGRLEPQKGFDLLIDSWALKKNQLKDWVLDIYGEGEWREMLQDKIRVLDLEKNIFLKGSSKNIEVELLKSSIFLFSSRYEGFGLVLLEAMQKGIPSVSFNCPHGPSELLSNGSGYLVPLYDIEKFSDCLLELADNYNIRCTMGNLAKKESCKYSKEIIMEEWYNLFNSLIK